MTARTFINLSLASLATEECQGIFIFELASLYVSFPMKRLYLLIPRKPDQRMSQLGIRGESLAQCNG